MGRDGNSKEEVAETKKCFGDDHDSGRRMEETSVAKQSAGHAMKTG